MHMRSQNEHTHAQIQIVWWHWTFTVQRAEAGETKGNLEQINKYKQGKDLSPILLSQVL